VVEVVVVGSIGYAEVMVAGSEGYCYVAAVVVEECGCVVVAGWVGIERILYLIERRFLGLFLLMENDGVLQFCIPCPVSIDVLPSGLSPLSNCLPSHDGFLLLAEPLNFLLHPA
jgi:hypothetical protein